MKYIFMWQIWKQEKHTVSFQVISRTNFELNDPADQNSVVYLNTDNI